ncbi:MAG: hypothetical protein AB1830_03910 [Pseudomonadota bacterium]
MKRSPLLLAFWLLACPAAFALAAQDRAGQHLVQEEIAGHQRMAAAHRGAAECLQAGAPLAECVRTLEEACKGVAAGRRCGMKVAKGEAEDTAALRDRHLKMADAHEAAAQCLASGREMEACEKRLRQDCRGLSINTHCGMRAHH